jgi:hypothetical protein
MRASELSGIVVERVIVKLGFTRRRQNSIQYGIDANRVTGLTILGCLGVGGQQACERNHRRKLRGHFNHVSSVSVFYFSAEGSGHPHQPVKRACLNDSTTPQLAETS